MQLGRRAGKSVQGESDRCAEFLSLLRSSDYLAFVPMAYAMGFILAPLRGFAYATGFTLALLRGFGYATGFIFAPLRGLAYATGFILRCFAYAMALFLRRFAALVTPRAL